jgi:hypothetical protein
VERCGQWSGISLMDPGNVERPAVETQVSRMISGKMWPVEKSLASGVIDTRRPVVENMQRRVDSVQIRRMCKFTDRSR